MREFLRWRNGILEVARWSNRYTAADRSRAIDVLRGSVLILRHPYEADPFSGAGNCWCGRSTQSELHNVTVLAAPLSEIPQKYGAETGDTSTGLNETL